METNTLSGKIRVVATDPSPKALRRLNRIPAVIYGQGRTPITLTVDMNEFRKLLNHVTSQSLIHLSVEGDTKTVMIKELQRHPVSRNLIHADFYEVDMTKEIQLDIPVIAVGDSPGVEDGGILQIIRRELEVVCLPGNIPEAIEIDVSQLGIGDSIHVSEVHVGSNVALAWNSEEESDYTVITVSAPTVEEKEGGEKREEDESAGGDAGAEDQDGND